MMTAREKRPETKTIVFDCACTNQGGDRLIAGIADVTAPAAKIRVPRGELPDVALRRHESYERLIERRRGIEAMATAVACPCEESSLMSIPPSAVGDGSAAGTSGWPLRPQRRQGPAGFRGPLSRATERTR